ncbi:hypothetical protein EQG41_16220 [Billgrantia azerbaijanica]|nr:hypothetical protein EQG41_16220 [Halomonas azerbaijanica]
MAVLRTTRRLLRAVSTHYANRRRDASLRDYDPHLLKDIGLRWEQGRLAPLNPEHEPATAARRHKAETRDAHETCPHCGSRLT